MSLSRRQKLVAVIAGGALVAVVVVALLLLLSGNDYEEFGGSLEGQPVANLAGGISEEAHEELEACGFSDEDAEQLASTSGVTARFDPSGEPTGSIDVTQVAPGIVELNCLSD